MATKKVEHEAGRNSPAPAADVPQDISELTVEKGVPIIAKQFPTRQRWHILTKMEPGDSVFVPSSVETTERLQSTVASYSKTYGILGRGRGVNRTAANPLDVILLCDTPLPVVVAETVTADNVKPSVAELMLAEGRVILKNPAHAFRVYPRLWNTNDEARKAFEREKTATFPYKGFVLGDCRTPLVPVSYQLAGKGQQPAELWFHPAALSDCRAWLTGRLGELAQYRRLPKELS